MSCSSLPGKSFPGRKPQLMQDTPWTASLRGLLEASCWNRPCRWSCPDEFLTNVIRASQVHCMLAARSEDRGRRVAPWISSDRYGPLESEANSVIRGMDLLGQSDFARRGLEFFIKRYHPNRLPHHRLHAGRHG